MKSTKSIVLTISILTSITVLNSCINETEHETIIINNQNLDSIDDSIIKEDYNDNDTTSLKLAISAITSPKETFLYYEALIDYLADKLKMSVVYKQRKTYQEVNEMLINEEVDFAFICSGAYVDKRYNKHLELLAVPVVNNKALYQAYIIVHKNSNITKFEELKDKNFVFTDPMSNTGRFYAEKRLIDLDTDAASFFKSISYTYGHDFSIQLVSNELVDGASIDGLVFEYMKATMSNKVKNLKIIEKSEYFGIPPVVSPISLNIELKTKIQQVLFNMHKDSLGNEILSKLMIDKFTEGEDSNYNTVRALQNLVIK
jgi:phosphate/phosphite/phosphonate ABC transporter binding protein